MKMGMVQVTMKALVQVFQTLIASAAELKMFSTHTDPQLETRNNAINDQIFMDNQRE